jgi:hypothetical protein
MSEVFLEKNPRCGDSCSLSLSHSDSLVMGSGCCCAGTKMRRRLTPTGWGKGLLPSFMMSLLLSPVATVVHAGFVLIDVERPEEITWAIDDSGGITLSLPMNWTGAQVRSSWACTYSLTRSLVYTLTPHSRAHSLARSRSRSLAHSLSRSLTCWNDESRRPRSFAHPKRARSGRTASFN